MVPVVEFRGHDEAGKWPKAQTNVGVKKQPQHDLHHRNSPGKFGAESCSNEEEEGGCNERPVEGMGTKTTHPIHVLWRVVNSVETPQLRDFVVPTMGPVTGKVKQRNTDQQQVRFRNGLDVRP